MNSYDKKIARCLDLVWVGSGLILGGYWGGTEGGTEEI